MMMRQLDADPLATDFHAFLVEGRREAEVQEGVETSPLHQGFSTGEIVSLRSGPVQEILSSANSAPVYFKRRTISARLQTSWPRPW
jgi:hypothetical protein